MKAIRWYRIAAEHRQAEAQYNLGAMYARGVGVDIDHIKAYMWFSIAGDYSDSEDQLYILSEFLLTPSQVTQAERMAKKWRLKYGMKR